MFSTVSDLLKAWLHGVNEKHVDDILKLYNEKAVLLPTFSNQILLGPDSIRRYFEGIGEKQNLSVHIFDDSLKIHQLRDDLLNVYGVYTWRFAVKGEINNYEARFTYTVDLSDERPILHHHSSLLPRQL